MITSLKISVLAAAIFASGALTGGLVTARLGLGPSQPSAAQPGNMDGPETSATPPSHAAPHAPAQDARRKDRPGPRLPGGQRIEVLRRMEESIPLDPLQRDRIRALVQEAEQRMQRDWEAVLPRVRSEMRDLNRRIDAELRPEQRARLDALLGRRAGRRTNDAPSSLR